MRCVSWCSVCLVLAKGPVPRPRAQPAHLESKQQVLVTAADLSVGVGYCQTARGNPWITELATVRQHRPKPGQQKTLWCASECARETHHPAAVPSDHCNDPCLTQQASLGLGYCPPPCVRAAQQGRQPQPRHQRPRRPPLAEQIQAAGVFTGEVQKSGRLVMLVCSSVTRLPTATIWERYPVASPRRGSDTACSWSLQSLHFSSNGAGLPP